MKKLSSESIGLNRTVAALSVARLADALGNSLLFVVIPLYVAKLPAPWFPWSDEMRAGFLISTYGFVNAFLQPFAGALSDRVSRRKPFIQAGLVLMGVGTLLFLSAGQFADLLMLRAIQGCGVALTIPASMALMATASSSKTRGGSMGIYSTARMAGFALGPLIGGFLYDRFGRKPFIVGGLLLMGIATAVLGEARTSGELIWLRVIQGAGAAGIAAPAFALAADLARRGGEARQMSFITMGFGLGIATGPFLAGLLAGTDFDLPFVLFGVLLVLSAWVVYRNVPETVRQQSEIPAESN